MFDYLQKFNSLPRELRDKISSPEIMAALSDLEKKYQVDLAMVVMKVMIKSLEIKNLPLYFVSECSLNQASAESLNKEIVDRVFSSVYDYLNIDKEKQALDLDRDINLIIREARLILPSNDLISRLKTILSTYLKGIRNRVSVRDTLAKEVNFGGLSLSMAEIDTLLKVCDSKNFKNLEIKSLGQIKIPNPLERLEKIISAAETGSEYNLKQAIALGQIKKPENIFDKNDKLDTKHEIAAPDKELELSAPKETLGLVAPKAEAATSEKIIIPEKSVVTEKPLVSEKAMAPEKSVVTEKPVVPEKPVAPEKPLAQEKIIIPEKPPVPQKPIIIARPVAPSQALNLGSIASSRPEAVYSGLKHAMHDIKPVPKVMGPIEELQYLNLVNFRRLGKTPEEITAKIFSKIKLLELEGYDKMISGVKAWRQSPVNHLYLKMMKDSINKGLKIKDFVASLNGDTKNYLNFAEIEAILVMNGKLIF